MDIRRITEVGVAVRDLAQATELFQHLFNASVGEVIDVPRYGMHYRMCRVGKVDFEIMAPTVDTGVIADFLRKRGEGLHHVCFEVPSLEESIAGLTAKGAVMAGPPTPGANGTQVVFVHPKSMNGVLVELVQKPAGGGADGAH